MLIRLTYAIGDKPARQQIGIWPSTWAAIEWAQGQGALVAFARKVSQ